MATGTSTAASKEALRSRIYILYEDLNRDAWFWHWQILQEATILGLLDDRSRTQLDKEVRGYHEELNASANELTLVWKEFLSNPGTPRAERAKKTIEVAGTKLHELQGQRQKHVSQMIDAILR